jgi:hypothetical protein
VTRSRASAKQAGTAFETAIVRYLAAQLEDDRIERRRLSGAQDRGDIAGVRVHGQRVVIECKNYGGRLMVGPWLTEADIERGHDDAAVGMVIAKRRGTTDPADQTVLMTVRDLIALMSGARPEQGES